MTGFEKELREALDLFSSVPVAGRNERARMSQAEMKVLGVANAFATMEKEGRLRIGVKEEKPHDEAGNVQQDA